MHCLDEGIKSMEVNRNLLHKFVVIEHIFGLQYILYAKSVNVHKGNYNACGIIT